MTKRRTVWSKTLPQSNSETNNSQNLVMLNFPAKGRYQYLLSSISLSVNIG